MQYAIKTKMGLFKKSDEDCADYVIMTRKEFEKLDQELAVCESERNEALADAKAIQSKLDKRDDDRDSILNTRLMNTQLELHRLQRARDADKEEIQSVKAELDKAHEIIKNLRGQLLLSEEEAERNATLNRQFQKISRQHANRDSGRQKKEGFGYSVLSSTQVKDRVPSPYFEGEYIYIDSWKTSIRTPFDAGLPLQSFRRDLRADLIDTILGLLGISLLQAHSKNGEMWQDGKCTDAKSEMNGVYKWIYHMDTNNDYWIIDIYHNKPILLAEILRPVKKADNTGRKTTGGDKHEGH